MVGNKTSKTAEVGGVMLSGGLSSTLLWKACSCWCVGLIVGNG